MNLGCIFTMAHNADVVTEVERKLNSLIRSIHDAGGQIYLCRKSNKDFCIKLDDEISIAWFARMNQEIN